MTDQGTTLLWADLYICATILNLSKR